MRHQKMFVIAGSIFLLVFFFSATASAQVDDIIADYCEEVADNVDNTQRELENASEDLVECGIELNECFLGEGLIDEPSFCIKEYQACIRRGKRDQKQACVTFLREFQRDTRGAEQQADRRDVDEEFLAWFNSDAQSREECIMPAQMMAEKCADTLLGD